MDDFERQWWVDVGGVVLFLLIALGAAIYGIGFGRSRKRWRGLWIAGVGCVFLLPAWNDLPKYEPDSAAFAGTYRGDNSVPVLRSDGTFKQRYIDLNGTVYHQVGSWGASESDTAEDADVDFSGLLVPIEGSVRKMPMPDGHGHGRRQISYLHSVIHFYEGNAIGVPPLYRTSRATDGLREVTDTDAWPMPRVGTIKE